MNEGTTLKKKIGFAMLATSLAVAFTLPGLTVSFAQDTENANTNTITAISDEANNTLGEPFYVENGTITGSYTYSANGTFVDNNNTTSAINVTNSGMILTIPIDNNGTLYGQGQGVLTTEDGESATYTFQFMGQLTEGGTPPHGSWYFWTNSTGSLAFLNSKVGITQGEIGSNGEFSTRVWEWN
jgi:hypothetical protein